MASETPCCAAKWEEFVGLDAEEAKKKVLEIHKNLNVVIVPEGSMLTQDFRKDRVRLFTDSSNKVTKVPKLG